MKKSYFRIHFATFDPIYVWELGLENALIRAKHQRLEEGLSTQVLAAFIQKSNGDFERMFPVAMAEVA